jgi:predicted nucleic acid-binding protein
MRAFLDANILFTAAYSPDGKARFLIDNGADLGVALVSSEYAIEEAVRNLVKKKPMAIIDFEKCRAGIGQVPSLQRKCPIQLRDKDVPIYVTAVGHQCTHLITGDLKDFGPFMNSPHLTEGVVIQTVGEFLDSLVYK